MTVEQWKNLSEETRESLINAVFNNSYLAITHANMSPTADPIIKEVLKVAIINGDTAYITIRKTVKIKN